MQQEIPETEWAFLNTDLADITIKLAEKTSNERFKFKFERVTQNSKSLYPALKFINFYSFR